mgnify:CR=1 FL=1
MAESRELLTLLPRLRRFARALARNPADADDLVQAALERALKARHQWQPGTRLDAWTMRIVRNCWIDEARARTRRAQTFAPEEAGERVGRVRQRIRVLCNALASHKRLQQALRVMDVVEAETALYAQAAEVRGAVPTHHPQYAAVPHVVAGLAPDAAEGTERVH